MVIVSVVVVSVVGAAVVLIAGLVESLVAVAAGLVVIVSVVVVSVVGSGSCLNSRAGRVIGGSGSRVGGDSVSGGSVGGGEQQLS